MPTLTIPEKIKKGEDLVVIPRKEYEGLLRVKKKSAPLALQRSKLFRMPKKHEKFYNELDKRLAIALREVKEGKVTGPFATADEAIRFLHSRESRAKQK
ncbi:MAG: hypothetical protein G01um101470_424 [Parcubacteria group bacterium Gr01-1014_70]|nr:MAG: hypothetical protein G01um101470_424 [Parcubacteria group bacterium Gr01-1014_70]